MNKGTKEIKATAALPWKYGGNHSREIFSDSDCTVVCTVGERDDDTRILQANAGFIVRACNSHEELVAALSGFTELTRRLFSATSEQQRASAIVALGHQEIISGQVLAKARGEG